MTDLTKEKRKYQLWHLILFPTGLLLLWIIQMEG